MEMDRPMPQKIIFISYATLNTPYIQVIESQLIPSPRSFKLPHYIEYITDKGNWNKNTNYKSTFILKMLNKHKCPVIFLDADATILKFPSLFYEIPNDYDLCAHYLDWHKMWRKTRCRD